MRKFWVYNLISMALGLTFLYLDLLLPLGFAGGIPYITLILVGLHAESEKLVIYNFILGLAFSIMGFYLSPDSGNLTLAAFNRLLSIGTLCLTTYFCLMNLKLIEEKYNASVLKTANDNLKIESGYVQLSRDISWIANMPLSLSDGVKLSLQKICEFTKWQVGHLYLPEENGQALIPTDVWYFDNEKKVQNFS